MAKTETVSQDTIDPLAQFNDMPATDIPGNDPLLDPGRYNFQFVGYKAELQHQDDGPVWKVLIMLDPVEYLEEADPQEGFEDFRQFHTVWARSRRDMKTLETIATAFGADSSLSLKTSDGAWPLLDDAKGGFGYATVKAATIKGGRRAGEETRNISGFSRSV